MQNAEIEQMLEVFRRPERPRTTVEERLTAIEDRQRVREVLMAYGYLCDARLWDELLELYTDDVERVLGGTLTENIKGKDALREVYLAPVLPREDGDAPPAAEINAYEIRHLIVGDIVRLGDDGETAWAAASYSLVASKGDIDDFVRAGHEGGYILEFRKVDGAWLVSKFTVFSENARNPLFRSR
jgi:hypothetical protein